MRRKTRTKVKKGLIISGILIGVILLIIGIIIAIKLHQQPEISYDDGITCKKLLQTNNNKPIKQRSKKRQYRNITKRRIQPIK